MLLLMLMIMATMVHAQYASITIGGNVYGGGNEGDTRGSTNVTVRAGEINAVFGGARMANVDGSAFVNIDGEHASDDILIPSVYGGNDIAGTIGTSTVPVKTNTNPYGLTEVGTAKGKNAIDDTWNAYIRTSRSSKIVNEGTDDEETVEDKVIIIGTLYGGGNGDYGDSDDDGKYVAGTTYEGMLKPVLGKTYLEVLGGCIAHLYGGGNNATVTENTTICINNSSDVLSKSAVAWAGSHGISNLGDVLAYLQTKVNLNTFQSDLTSYAFNFARIFGGNNKAPMAIRPKWNLQAGVIRDIYSGGNQGAMTAENGILLHVNPTNSNALTIENVFGGCRMADVNPAKATIDEETIDGTFYPAGYAARVLIEGGDIQNVYGGNDISGNIYGGNAVGIHSSIKGDVYGGGNGSYAYTDNVELGALEAYKDFYYTIPTGKTSVEALNAFRPNAEAVSIRLLGTAAKPTIIGGAVYCGGNSATLHNATEGVNAAAELKIGSYVMADKVFLGNNGANMVKTNEKDDNNGIAEGVLRTLRSTVAGSTSPYNSMDLTEKAQFDKYMDGVAMDVMPRVVFDDVGTYVPYSTYFGSFYCGGNVGSMKIDGAIDISFNDKVVVFDKVVGGSNEANVYQTDFNAQYLGGLLGNPDNDGNKLILHFNGLKIEPKRWVDKNDKSKGLEWNTVAYNDETKVYDDVDPITSGSGNSNAYDLARRLKGGNIYGGCYSNGHVEGNVVINLDATIHERDKLFDITTNEGDKNYENVENAEKDATFYNISERKTGVIFSQQGTDCFISALNVFGGGYGGDSEIWGSATINLNSGYTFQIFGGGEMGAIGRAVSHKENATNPTIHDLTYEYDKAYSTYINLNGDASLPGVAKNAQGDSPNMAECEYLYGGAFEGLIAGNTYVNLGNGRIFNSFGGSCNADILGHVETYIGSTGFPYVRDYVYGGNDLGGRILNAQDGIDAGDANFTSRIRNEVKGMVDSRYNEQVEKIAAYTEYTQGRADYILGGGSGNYDYTSDLYKVGTKENGCRVAYKPYIHNTFVNFRPNTNANNEVSKIFGAGEGYPGDREGDKLQDHSYVLIDIPDNVENFANTEVFGAGAYNGLGMTKTATETFASNFDLNEVSAITDLMRGRFGAAYGGSYEQGVTRRTMVNVPEGSTIKIGSIFGGAYGSETFEPCDVYEANVNYLTTSEQAYLIYDPERTDEKTGEKLGNELSKGAIYGGNNAERRTLYGKININVPVRQKNYQFDDLTTATIYGAGCGSHTWNEYTEVNLNEGAKVWQVFGGGEAGGVMNSESIQAYISGTDEINYKPSIWPKEKDSDPDVPFTDSDWIKAWSLGSGYDDGTFNSGYTANTYAANDLTNLNNPLVRVAEMDDRETKTYRYNTNVIIHKGAYVGSYAYGGGYGLEGDAYYGSGDVYGTTYIALLGGIVNKDIYAAGTSGAVYNLFGANFTASTNAYIAGGMLRNVYGGGWKGDVGYTTMQVSADRKTASFTEANEKPGETHVVIGIRPDQTDDNLVAELNKVLGKTNATKSDYGFYAGVPAIQRNAYGGGEGGAIFGSSYLTINNGYIGYVHLNAGEMQNEQGKVVTATGTTTERYEEKIHDDTYWENEVWKGLNRLSDCGNVFGGGYDVKSSVDFSHITMWNGIVRNSLVGGGEIATIGRGAIDASGPSNSIRTLRGLYKAGKTNIEMFNGHVLRNVFGGGKGYNIFGYGQEGTLYMDGYVFGQTEVHIHGGEVGTDEGLAEGYGNVFGGGDIGYVYSPSIYSDKTKEKINTHSPGHIYYYDAAGNLTEDCKVVVSPYLQVKSGTVSYGGKTYGLYDYVPTDYLNTLPKKNDAGNWIGGWEKLITGDSDGEDERGIYIHNAVFGGGNVSSNSDQTYANATTIFGNTTATLYDVFHRDFITVGTEHTGGIYGGGNLSVVDGYRELNITNYGTDYYGLKQTISIDEYRSLSNRERAYFQLEYKCTATSETQGNKTGITIGGVFYETDKRLTEEEYLKLANNTDATIASLAKSSFEPYGFCSIYAGRLLNTIQRADLCGVFGSRMVLQGAKDRVAEVGEDIDYTINRVGELSLNQQRTVRTTANGYTNPDTDDDALHGNYFGIYSLVNYLGNMTSDVHFSDPYINGNGVTETDKTYFTYKANNYTSSDRNKGKSFNQVALASGVFLELTTENSTKDHKDYGYVTGVIELDLINVKKDLVGGGFVYAKNEHRVPIVYPNMTNVILSDYNKQPGNEAVTYKRLQYSADQEGDWTSSGSYTLGTGTAFEVVPYETSGNFIHTSKRIVDDCYPTNNAYEIGSANYSEAHYWYVKGEVYIYDQKVSAYTGSATAYSKEVHLPLTITAASNGKLQLLNVKPNLYAYYTDKDGTRVKIGTNDAQGKPIDKVTVNNESDSYGLNDVISWWDWHQMSASDRQYFVTETYVNCVKCSIDGVTYEAGTYVMNQEDYDTFMANSHDIRDSQGYHFTDDNNNDIGKTYVFRSSNNVSHETGYLLTFDMNTPKVWDDYYSPTTGSSADGKIMKSVYEAKFTEGMTDAQKQAIIDAWRVGPTFTTTKAGVYGKQSYKAGEVVTKAVHDNAGEGQDKMEKAYVATESVTYPYNGLTKTVNPGTAISETEYNGIGSFSSSFAEAWFCTYSVKLTNENYLLYGELKTAAEIAEMKAIDGKLATDAEIDAALTPAYICTEDGEYGGQQFVPGTNYSAIQAWSSLPAADRTNFNYNFDALDLLVNSDYLTVNPDITTSPSHESTVDAYHAPYTDQVDVEYKAVFKKNGVDVEFNGQNLTDGAILTNKQFETIRNDKRHYTHIETKNNGDYVYIAKNNFVYLGTPYGRGQVVDIDTYNANRSDVEEVQIENAGKWYYCYENYTPAATFSTVSGTAGQKGSIISESIYKDNTQIPNYQQYFIIQGQEPTETTTLYVSRESNAYDVMKEKIITVVYQYTYYEDEDDGSVKMTNELHVINVHLELESGVPQIGQLSPPATVLPGQVVGLKAPDVNPGLYEVISNGWELFSTQDDAENHRNGVPFENNNTPVYWYQNGRNYIAFYSKTYLGKTYSNPVPLSVANYHDLDAIMKDKERHLYVDKSNVERPCKIYLDNRKCESDETKSELDLLKDFFDLSLQTPTTNATTYTIDGTVHNRMNTHVHGARNLEFFLNSDVSPKKYTSWTPIGNDNTTGDTGQCFEGNLHGDGYTISGLNNSLFGHLCGEVYNLGVTGSFTGAGIAETGDGYVENCWIKTTGTPVTTGEGTHYAVFANPSRTEGDTRGQIQVENCYYPASNTYDDASSSTHGKATQMLDKAFFNGEVAYNLNGFYLHKRFYQGTNLSSGTEYRYLQPNADGSLPDNMSTGYYPNDYAIYQPDVKVKEGETKPYMGYVESRFYDGDYRYAGGTIPESTDIRMRTVTVGEGDDAVTTPYYVPIWPDDYIFFGQTLNYGYVDGYSHQVLPSHINKSNERLQTDAGGNRVYRAPAYYGSSEMQTAYFNPNAVFAQTKKDDESVVAYKGMTAIDFTGNGDEAYNEGLQQSGKFYQPLLDDDGLTGFRNVDLTQNLLAYAPQETKNKATHDVLDTYFGDLACEELGDDASTDADEAKYHRIATVNIQDEQSVRGHVVFQKVSQEGTMYIADRDHFLVDKNDFYCPISYTFTDGKNNTDPHLMWYQRKPDNFVDSQKGWEAVSLPFTAVLVTTQSKGELTHFYQGSTTGHEYWLREYKGKADVTPPNENTFIANMSKPDAGSASKNYTNTFLWDYYYSKDEYLDKNTDKYQQNYYRNAHTYSDYSYALAGTPYIIGLPGARYYEFDLSGEWTPRNRYGDVTIASPGRQNVTFVSAIGAAINASNTDMENKATYNGLTFTSCYTTKNLEAEKAYLLNGDGSSFDKNTQATTSVPFRPYFTGTPTNTTRSIIFGNEQEELKGEAEHGDPQDGTTGTLHIWAKKDKIYVESSLSFTEDLRVVTPAGISVATFTVKPGQTVEVDADFSGMYIVHTLDGLYTKKVVVKRE